MSLKYQPGVVESLLDHYQTGLYTVKELCKHHNISTSAWYHWKEKVPEFKKKLEVAESRKRDNIAGIATRGLIKLLNGAEYEEVHEEFETVYEKDIFTGELTTKLQLKTRRITNKFIMPNAAAVQFALRNLDKQNYHDLVQHSVKTDIAAPIPVILKMPGGIDLNLPSNLNEDVDLTPDNGAGSTEG